MKKIRAAVIGAGDRGTLYSQYALKFPNQLQIVTIAEPDTTRRTQFADLHSIPEPYQFDSWDKLFRQPKLCDAVIIATQDRQHYEPVIKALTKGYHILVEKPLSPCLHECLEIMTAVERTESQFMLCYVLRYTPFFQKLKELLQRGVIGDIRHISLDMNVAYWHHAHSYVRGNWRSSTDSSPMILAKCSHDFDILTHLIKRNCLRVSSFGHLRHFRSNQAPMGAAPRCKDCGIEPDCPYSAKRLYLSEFTGWPVSTISPDPSLASREKAIDEGPYGRCVYYCDNDVVDHQVVNMEFEDQITATLTMSAFTHELSRTIRILGTKGEIQGNMNHHQLFIHPFGLSPESITVSPYDFGQHYGGDYGLLRHFLQQCREPQHRDNQTYCKEILTSHILAWAAEESRLSGQTIEIHDWINQ